MWLIVAAGAMAFIYAAYNLPQSRIDGYFLLLTVITAVIGSRIAIRIRQINVNITVDDTFVFIALLHYGGEAAVMLGALAGVCSGTQNQPQGQNGRFRRRRARLRSLRNCNSPQTRLRLHDRPHAR